MTTHSTPSGQRIVNDGGLVGSASKDFEGGAVGFIGIGVMGRSLAGHLLKAGYPLVVHSRTKAKAGPLLQAGAQWANTPAELAPQCKLIFTMVGFPDDVEKVYLGKDGIIAHAAPCSLLVDLTTSWFKTAQLIEEEARYRHIATLDAPVTGGDIGARNAQLSIMVGGDPAAFARAEPVLKLFGPTVVYHGLAGSGQNAKMCNQIMIAGTMIGLCEALAYAKFSGLDPQAVLKSTSGGAAGSWSLQNLAPRILKDDFAPGFYAKHLLKDLGLARGSCGNALDVPGLTLAFKLYRELCEAGHGDLGTQALWKLYEAKLPKQHP